MRITLAQVVVAITAQNKRCAHARRILTISSNQIDEPLGMVQMVRTEAVPRHPPHTSDTRPAFWDVRAGRKVTTDRNAQRLHSDSEIHSISPFNPLLVLIYANSIHYSASPAVDLYGVCKRAAVFQDMSVDWVRKDHLCGNATHQNLWETASTFMCEEGGHNGVNHGRSNKNGVFG